MPFYAYECIHCGEGFDVRATIREKIAGLTFRCPRCGSEDVKQKLTAGAVLRGGVDMAPGGFGCGPGAGPGCCG